MPVVRNTCLGTLLACAVALPAPAQTPAPAPNPDAPPPILVIYREAVKVGKNAAHELNEQGWAGVLAKAQWPSGWLGTNAMTGPNESWFFTGYPNWAAFEKDTLARETAESLAGTRPHAAAEADLVNSTTQIMAGYRPRLSYRATGDIGTYRFFTINTVRVKPGRDADFTERWRAIVAAHEKANLDERWAVYAVTAGAPTGTYMFIYARKSLAELDAAGAAHTADAYRDAIGEAGRARNNEVFRDVVESDVTNHFQFIPKMSYVPKSWVDADPTFWTPPPPAPPTTKKPAEKK
jgi:hypothetical protein